MLKRFVFIGVQNPNETCFPFKISIIQRCLKSLYGKMFNLKKKIF